MPSRVSSPLRVPSMGRSPVANLARVDTASSFAFSFTEIASFPDGKLSGFSGGAGTDDSSLEAGSSSDFSGRGIRADRVIFSTFASFTLKSGKTNRLSCRDAVPVI